LAAGQVDWLLVRLAGCWVQVTGCWSGWLAAVSVDRQLSPDDPW
jgi:hypothetical protein